MISIPKGTKDVLPGDSYKWQHLENIARDTAQDFGFKEIRTPVFEHTELFSRGVGDTTDIVNKEMYTFLDKGNRSITLKPEGTAGAARMFIENGLSSSPLPLKAYYITPAFRYERPQAGRLRQFHQFGLELFGSKEPEADAEVISAAYLYLMRAGLENISLKINSIGCKDCRKRYNEALKDYFRPHLDNMCALCKDRFIRNPLRILDCKEECCQKIIAGAPNILDYLCPDCAAHFERVKSLLASLDIPYRVDGGIVRGLDYYTRTVFEFVSNDIGSQGTICGGGRYDGLISGLGGPETPAIGFAVGLERLMLLMENKGVSFGEDKKPLLFLGSMGDNERKEALKIIYYLRSKGIFVEGDLMARSVKAQIKYADKIGANYFALLGESEMASGKVNIKDMQSGTMKEVEIKNIANFLKE